MRYLFKLVFLLCLMANAVTFAYADAVDTACVNDSHTVELADIIQTAMKTDRIFGVLNIYRDNIQGAEIIHARTREGERGSRKTHILVAAGNMDFVDMIRRSYYVNSVLTGRLVMFKRYGNTDSHVVSFTGVDDSGIPITRFEVSGSLGGKYILFIGEFNEPNAKAVSENALKYYIRNMVRFCWVAHNRLTAEQNHSL